MRLSLKSKDTVEKAIPPRHEAALSSLNLQSETTLDSVCVHRNSIFPLVRACMHACMYDKKNIAWGRFPSIAWDVKWLHKLLLEIPTQLETERLVIRRYAEGDGQGLHLLLERNENRKKLADHVDEATEVRTVVEAEIRIRQWVADWVARTRFVMGLCLKPSNEQIGQIWIEPRNWDVPSFELGWFLDSGFWGKGLATEASRCAMKFIFECLHAHKIIVITRDNNERSYRLAQRLGFTREGHLRECSMKNGLRWGLFHYGMLGSEYETHVEGASN